MRPPRQLDDADVVFWAWSDPEPFFQISATDGSVVVPIHGLAVCRYGGSGAVYRFSCDRDWEVENDSPWDTIEEALAAPSAQYEVSTIAWQAW